jgi:hypothetical protein
MSGVERQPSNPHTSVNSNRDSGGKALLTRGLQLGKSLSLESAFSRRGVGILSKKNRAG